MGLRRGFGITAKIPSVDAFYRKLIRVRGNWSFQFFFLVDLGGED
jgi:hypothetical protein